MRLRIRALINKRQAAEGPDFDEYQIHRRISRQYKKIDPTRRKSSTKKPAPVISDLEPVEIINEQPASFGVVSVTVKAE